MPGKERQIRKRDPLRMECAVRTALDVLKGRWKPSLLFELKDGPKRFSELQAALRSVSAQALAAQLRQLERDGVIARMVHADAPVRVEYSITELGSSLSEAMDRLDLWRTAYLERLQPGGTPKE
jgi:DNA-binding HxlR family transcriptional regulator